MSLTTVIRSLARRRALTFMHEGCVIEPCMSFSLTSKANFSFRSGQPQKTRFQDVTIQALLAT